MSGRNYEAFLARKLQHGADTGFEPLWMPSRLFDFQSALVECALRRGRSALFEDCGMGKSGQELTWAENVVRHTNRSVLILTPLAVGAQMVAEGEKFGIECHRSSGGSPARPGIIVTNYEKLAHFDASDFAGVVCDESSILKSFDGVRKAQVTEFMRTVPYRLLGTATAAPNDYIELGTSSEALGELGHMDMLARFFKNDQNTSDTKGRLFGAAKGWRFKGHAERPFWRWVCSWARACRRPSDLGFDDGRFILPPLIEREHVVEARSLADGMLFPLTAVGFQEEREERRRTIEERCEMVARLVDTKESALVWCHLNEEGDRLERLIPGALQIAGKDEDDAKEEKFAAFISGEARVLVTKQKIAGWGLNLQRCAHVVTFATHSFEQDYQAVRRCWRFGQTRPVVVDRVVTEGERGIVANLRRKQEAADRMFSGLVAHMNEAQRVERAANLTKKMEVIPWL